eukprot:1013699-Prymnesium_polylepis.1
MELRKLNGKRRVPGLSVRAVDASCCMAVDQGTAGACAAGLSLGRRAIATEGSGAQSGSFSVALAARASRWTRAAANAPLTLKLSADLFEAAAMRVVNKDLMVMMVAELKEELEVRGEGKTGNKAWLRRRLH